MRSLVERTTNEKLAEWLEENPREANQVVQKATVAARARIAARQARDLTRRKSGLDGAGLRASLSTARRATRASRSLFIVEATRRAARPRTPATPGAGDPPDPRQDLDVERRAHRQRC